VSNFGGRDGIMQVRVNPLFMLTVSCLRSSKFGKILGQYKDLCEIRSRDQVFGSAIVMDEGEDAFIILSESFFPKRMSYFGVVTDHIAFGPAANYYFSYLYKTAKELDL